MKSKRNWLFDNLSNITRVCFRWRGDQMERKIVSGKELWRSLRHHCRFSRRSANWACSFPKLILDNDGHDACGTGSIDAHGITKDDSSEPMETKTRDDLWTTTTTSQRWLCTLSTVSRSPLHLSRSISHFNLMNRRIILLASCFSQWYECFKYNTNECYETWILRTLIIINRVLKIFCIILELNWNIPGYKVIISI